MDNKIFLTGNNKKCLCGSGKKYKLCHGNMPNTENMKFKFIDINFSKTKSNDNVIILYGVLYNTEIGYDYILYLTTLEDGNLKLYNLIWNHAPIKIDLTKLVQTLVNKSFQLTKTINMWSREQSKNSAKAIMNEIKVPDSATSTNSISFRSNLLELPLNKWDSIWERINNRILFDDYFRIHGFSTSEVLSSIEILKIIFTSDWVKARYKEIDTTNNHPTMGMPFERNKSNSWFPAYHLARTALGAICVDPAWNYLIEIGLSINELKNFKKTKLLVKSLSRNSGDQHNICLAAELYKKNYLVGLEPSTGAGSATNDLLVLINENYYAIEVKEFSSKKPIKSLKMELADKCKKLPKIPKYPVIFHIVLKDNEKNQLKKENDFLNSLDSIITEIPKKISAIVIGNRFIDSTGGRIKRDVLKIIINDDSIQKSNYQDINKLFEKNFIEIVYPCTSVGTFIYFDNKNKEDNYPSN